MKCGPEVYPNLLLTMLAVRNWIRSLPPGKRLTRFPYSATMWDILGLTFLAGPAPAGVPNPCYNARRKTVCETCVQVFGKRHDLFEVNYALWGLICGFVGAPRYSCKHIARIYKTYKWAFNPEQNPCRPTFQYSGSLDDWIDFGYDFIWYPYRVSDRVPAANPRFKLCDPCDDPELPIEKFDYWLLKEWGGDLSGWPPRGTSRPIGSS